MNNTNFTILYNDRIRMYDRLSHIDYPTEERFDKMRNHDTALIAFAMYCIYYIDL